MKFPTFYLLLVVLLIASVLHLSSPLHAQTTAPTAAPAAATEPAATGASSPTAVSTAEAVKTPQAGWVHQIFGPAMSPLWLCSIILVALVINRTRAMRRGRIISAFMIEEVGRSLGQLDIRNASQAAAESGTLIGRAWSRGLDEFGLGFTPLNEALSNASVVALKSLRKYLWLITTISVIAPMFGLIGTVIGMIITFSTLAETGGVDKSKLAVGLSFALYKTAGGLIIAIPAIISGRYFASRVSAYAEEVESEILTLAHHYSKGLSTGGSTVQPARNPASTVS